MHIEPVLPTADDILPTPSAFRSPSPTMGEYQTRDALDSPSSPQSTGDVWGSDDGDIENNDQPAAGGMTELSELPRLQREHATNGYRDGVTAGKAVSIQEGFDEGFGIGARFGGIAGRLRGVLEGMKTALVGADREEDLKMVTDLLNQAEKDLTVEKIFGKDYWNEDGTWAYEVPGEDGDITFDEVVAAHPLVIHWEGKVSNLMKEWGINWTIPGREGDQDRVGEEERRTVKNVMPAATTKNALDW